MAERSKPSAALSRGASGFQEAYVAKDHVHKTALQAACEVKRPRVTPCDGRVGCVKAPEGHLDGTEGRCALGRLQGLGRSSAERRPTSVEM
eukprot:1131808-Pleurochrysis_carterae.AAC.6